MRQKINENPVLQAGLIGLLVVAFAVVFMTQVAGRGGEEEVAPPVDAAAPVDPAAPGAVTPPAVPLEPSATGAAVPDAAVPAPATTAGFKAGPGLPQDVVSAHEDGQTVVLLIRRSKGIDDGEMVRIVDRLDDPSVSVFTTRINNVERYSRITIGVDVDRAPALIVIRPKRFDGGAAGGGAGEPQASVVYGLQSQQATEQRVRDAVYEGREDLPYHPG